MFKVQDKLFWGFLGLIVLGLSVFLYWNHFRTKNCVIDNSNILFPGKPTLIFFVDTRSQRSVLNISQLLDYFDLNNVPINIGIVYLFGNEISFRGKYLNCDRKAFPRTHLSENSFFLYNARCKIVKSGSILSQPRNILSEVRKLYPKLAGADITDYIKEGENIENCPLMNCLLEEIALSGELNCFVFYEEICFGCNSGRDLIRLDQMSGMLDNVSLFYITMYEYNKTDIEIIKRNEGLSIAIIATGPGCKDEWENIKQNIFNPFLGCFLVINNNGRIEHITYNWLELSDWLLDHSKKISD